MRQLRNVGMVFVILFFVACGSYSPWDSSVSGTTEAGDGATFESPVGDGNISEIAVDGNGFSIDLNALGVSAGEDVVLSIFSYSTSSNTASFQIGSSPDESALLDEDRPFQEIDDDDPQTSLNNMLRDVEASLCEEEKGSSPMFRSSSKSYSEGDEREFKVLSSMANGNSFETVTATLRAQTEYFEIYVDNRNANSLTDSEIAELAHNFSEVVPIENEIFGEPSDVNGDGRFSVLFTEGVNKLGASQGGIVTGFYNAVDEFPATKYPSSNEMEIYYTFVPDPNGDFGMTISKSFAISNIYPGVLPHEYQHMISFNQHYFLNAGMAEEAWLNEAVSHLAEDFYTIDTEDRAASTRAEITGYGLENPSRMASYLANMPNICFTCGSNLSQRGGGYAFLKYLTEQANRGNLPGVTSGAEFLHKLVDTDLRGVENIVTAAIGEGADLSEFKDLLGLFSLAVYLSDTGLTEDDRFEFSGINLRGAANDNRGTVLNGPAIQVVASLPFVESIVGNGATLIQISSSVIEESGGIFSFLASSNSNLGAYLIK